jgi:Icc protein
LIRNNGVDGKLFIRKSYISEYPRPKHFIVHISDTHITAADTGLYGSTAYSDKYLRQLFHKLEETELKPEAIIFTGDLADLGEPDAYKKIRDIVDPVAAKIGCEVIWVMGNHDSRDNFRIGLLDAEPSLETIDSVHMIGDLRIIVLDSTVHGAHWGAVSEAQLNWLQEILKTSAPDGTILAMHHPPVPSVVELAISVELVEQHKLADVLRGTDVRSIIAGHLHYSTNAMFAGIPVSVASATCYTQDLDIPEGGLKARDGAQAYNLMHVYADTIVHSVVPLGDYPIIKELSPETAARELKESGFTGFPKN